MNTIKTCAIGIVAGTFDYFVTHRINKICSLSNSIFCLNINHFISPNTLQTLYKPIHLTNTVLSSSIRSLIPSIPISAYNCAELLNLEPRYSKQPSGCCSDSILFRSNISNLVATSISEEFIFRYLFQKQALTRLAMLLPERIGKPLQSPAIRILISSLFFTFAHAQKASIAHHFTSGLINGLLMEKYGLFASISGHFMGNLLLTLKAKHHCENEIMQYLKRD